MQHGFLSFHRQLYRYKDAEATTMHTESRRSQGPWCANGLCALWYCTSVADEDDPGLAIEAPSGEPDQGDKSQTSTRLASVPAFSMFRGSSVLYSS